ncbi:MAG: hypothetical protein ACRCVN_01340 [Spirochaetia bacterium]
MPRIALVRWDWSLLVLAIYSGLFAVLAVRTIVGTFGTLELSAMTEREENLVKNIQLLEDYQKQLTERIKQLENNQETQKLLARRLGYYQVSERRVVIYGDESVEDQIKVGYPLAREETSYSVFDNGFWLFVIVSGFMYVFILASGGRRMRVR